MVVHVGDFSMAGGANWPSVNLPFQATHPPCPIRASADLPNSGPTPRTDVGRWRGAAFRSWTENRPQDKTTGMHAMESQTEREGSSGPAGYGVAAAARHGELINGE